MTHIDFNLLWLTRREKVSIKHIAHVNHVVLKWTREQTPFSIQDVSKILGFNERLLLEWENGLSKPSINEAKSLAKLYKFPFAAFFLSEIPNITITKFVDRRTRKMNIPKLTRELWDRITEMKSKREILLEITDPESLYIADFSYLKGKDVIQISSEIRRWMEVSTPFNVSLFKPTPFAYFRKMLEAKDILVFVMNEIPVEEVRGISIYYDSLPIIAVNSNDSDAAKTFTLFHELAHIIRKSSSLCSIDEDYEIVPEEIECNKIAAEILIPQNIVLSDNIVKSLLNKWDDSVVQRISGRYGVSKQTLIRKLYDLSKISRAIFEEKNRQYAQEYELIREKHKEQQKNKEMRLKYSNVYLSRVGKLFPELVLDAYYSRRISFGQTVNYLKIKTKHMDNIQKAVSGL